MRSQVRNCLGSRAAAKSRAVLSCGVSEPAVCGIVFPVMTQSVRTCNDWQARARLITALGISADNANTSLASSKDIPVTRAKLSGVGSVPAASIAPFNRPQTVSMGSSNPRNTGVEIRRQGQICNVHSMESCQIFPDTTPPRGVSPCATPLPVMVAGYFIS